MTRHLGAALALALAGMLAACGPEAPKPTTVALSISAAEDANGGAPTRVKVYYLTGASVFRSEDFFALFDEPSATLGEDLVEVDQYLLAPGEGATDLKVFERAVPTVGVVAAFRDIDQPGWRAVTQLTPRGENATTVGLTGNTVTLEVAAPE